MEVHAAIMEDAKNPRTVDIFGKEIAVRKYGCSRQGRQPLWFDTPVLNLFVQVTSNCNADCKFCIYNDCKKSSFDTDKFRKVLNYLSGRDDLLIGKMNLTGGEPTLNLSLFDEIINIIKEETVPRKKPEITINTNGIHLLDIAKYTDFVDSIGLSRHHYDDDINAEIFGAKNVATADDIREFNRTAVNPYSLQLRCNLIKGYIDSYEGITRYMDEAIKIGCHDCGFVTLAPNNDYCRERQIDFANLVQINASIVQVNEWDRIEDGESYCHCANYVYSSADGELCKFYSRLFCRNDNTDGVLVFDGQNLRYGFGGEILY